MELNQAQADRDARGRKEGFDCALTWNGRFPAVRVRNQKSGSEYLVTLLPAKPICSCRDYRIRCEGTALVCKHIVRVRLWLPSLADRFWAVLVPPDEPDSPAPPAQPDPDTVRRRRTELWG